MRVVREIEVGERKIAVRELTIGEIRNWLKESGAVSGDVVDATLFDDFSLPDLTMMTSLVPESINAMSVVSPSATLMIGREPSSSANGTAMPGTVRAGKRGESTTRLRG